MWFSPDGRWLAATSGNTVRLWDVATWLQVASLPPFTADVLGLAFSPDSRTLAIRDGSGTLWLWDLVKKREIGHSRGHTPTTPPSFAGSVAFSPDGRRLATSGGDSTVKLWDVGLLQEVVTLTGHEAPIMSLAFTPDGNTLATASSDTTVRLWQAPPLNALSREPADAPSLPPIDTIRLFTLQVLGSTQATLTSEGDIRQIDVTSVDGTDWHVQLIQSFDDLQEGRSYMVRFRAKADPPRSPRLAAHISEPDWHSIGLGENVPLSKDWRAYQYEFRAKELTAGNMVLFNLGERTGTVWIADFTVSKAEK
jgi:WD40 repeat protein